jgi:hypothetical protein
MQLEGIHHVTCVMANHYYLGPDQRPHLHGAAVMCTSWLAARGLAPAPLPAV